MKIGVKNAWLKRSGDFHVSASPFSPRDNADDLN